MSRVIHFEIHGSRPESLMEFYKTLLGWNFTRFGQMDFWAIHTGPKESPGIDGGMILRKGDRPKEGQSVNAFVCTVLVDNVDTTVAQATLLGGSMAVPKIAIPGMGWLAYLKDPDGNIFGVTHMDPAAA